MSASRLLLSEGRNGSDLVLSACVNVRSGRRAVVAAVLAAVGETLVIVVAAVVPAAEVVVVVLMEVKVEEVAVEAMVDIFLVFGEKRKKRRGGRWYSCTTDMGNFTRQLSQTKLTDSGILKMALTRIHAVAKSSGPTNGAQGRISMAGAYLFTCHSRSFLIIRENSDAGIEES